MISSNPTKVPNVVISLLNKSKEEAIAFVETVPKTQNSEYMFRVSNDNIISFSHSYNFDKGQGDNIGNLITLEVIDPENIFEQYLFTNSDLLMKSTEDIANSRKQALKSIEERIKLRSALEDFAKQPQITKTFTDDSFVVDVFGSNVSDYQKEKIQNEVNDALLNDLTSKLTSTQTGGRELAEKIIKKAKEKKVISITSVEYYDYTPPNQAEEVNQYYSVSAVFESNSLSGIYADFNLDKLEEQKTILPTPYFYFYYGLNNNPVEWTGPISAAFTDAQYQYSWETGQKSILLKFTTTFDFPAFSRLALDQKGLNTYLNPTYRVVSVIKPDLSYQNRLDFSPKPTDNLHNVICNLVIKDFLKQCTSKDINILVLLPDLNKLFSSLIPSYLGFITKGITGGSPFDRDAALVDIYSKIFEEMGFSAYYDRHANQAGLTGQQSNLKIGDIMTDRSPIGRSFAGFAQESATTTYAAQGPQSDEYYLGVSITKDITESYRDVINKIKTGLQNKLSLVDINLEVIDDLQFVNEFADYLNSKKSPLATEITKDKPILVFGDKYLMQKYLYGKKYYVTNGIVQEGQRKNVAGVEQDLDLKSLQQKYGFENKTTDAYLHEVDKDIFTDDYINTIAKKYFLKVDDTLKVNSGMYSIRTDDFSLDSATKAVAALKQCRIPVFKSGLSESNLLNVDLNFNDFYFAALRAVWAKVDELNLIAGDSTTSKPVNVNDLKVFNSQDYDKIKDQLKKQSVINDKQELDFFKMIEVFENPANQYSLYLKSSDQDKVEGIEKLIRLLSQDIKNGNAQNKLRVIIGSHTNTNTYIQYLSLFSKLVNNAYMGYIKTLPAFHISGTALSVPPILLLLEEINTIPYNSKNFLTRALNGLYQIIGFKHTISGDEMYSEFFINKSIQLDLPLNFEARK